MLADDFIHDGTRIKQIDQTHWKFSGKITIQDASEFHHIMNVINFEREILFDLTDTEYINSSFLGFLIEINQKANSNGGTLVIKSSKNIKKLFYLLHLTDFFNCFSDEDNQPTIN